MINDISFGILGGDRRQIALAESVAADGYPVMAFGFDGIEFSREIKKAGIEQVVAQSNTIILPLPVTSDGKNLKMDFSAEKIPLNDSFAQLLQGKQVFGGMMGRLYLTSDAWESVDTYDYYTREDFAVQNVVPTAEGAIGIAMQEYPGTISGSRCLVAGFGRIGKILAWMLRGIGASVTVSARKQSDIAWIASYGYHSILTGEIGGKFDIVFNTIPAVIFDRKVLARMHGRPLIIDLASPPGGVDYEAAEDCGFHVIHALSLPGKVAPKAAGEIIKRTIYNIMEE